MAAFWFYVVFLMGGTAFLFTVAVGWIVTHADKHAEYHEACSRIDQQLDECYGRHDEQ